MTMPQVVIAQAIAVAALPTFAAQIARGERPAMRRSLSATLRGVILLSLPAAAGLILLRMPIVAMLFERGAFDTRSTELVSWALLWYTAGLVSHSVVEITSRAFYALHDTRTPVFVGASAMGLNVALSLLLADWFVSLGWPPHGGLALANTLATSLEMVVLLVLMRRRLDGLEGARIWRGLGQSVFGAVLLGAAVLAWLALTAGSSAWLQGIGGVALGAVVYGVVLVLLRVEEVGELLSFLRGKFSADSRS